MVSFPRKPSPSPTSAFLHSPWLLASSIRIIVCPPHTRLTSPSGSCVPAGYTVVFKNEVTEDTVIKYMNDIVDAGGRLTQSFDPFLNVCPSFLSPELISTDVIVGLLRCHPRVSSPALEQKYHRYRLYWCVSLSVVSRGGLLIASIPEPEGLAKRG